MTLPTFLPIKDAAVKYGFKLLELKELVESGKIDAVQLPDGDLIVSEDRLKETLAKDELPEYKKYGHLAGNPIWLSEAERQYGISTPTLSRWVKAGFINKIGKEGNRILLDEQDVAYCAEIYHQRGGQGKRIFALDGTPYRTKETSLAA